MTETTATEPTHTWDREHDTTKARDELIAAIREGDRVRLTRNNGRYRESVDGPCKRADGDVWVASSYATSEDTTRIEVWVKPEPLPDFTTAMAWAHRLGFCVPAYWIARWSDDDKRKYAPWTPLRLEDEWRSIHPNLVDLDGVDVDDLADRVGLSSREIKDVLDSLRKEAKR